MHVVRTESEKGEAAQVQKIIEIASLNLSLSIFLLPQELDQMKNEHLSWQNERNMKDPIQSASLEVKVLQDVASK